MQFAASPLRPVEAPAASASVADVGALIPNVIKTWQTVERDEDGRVIEQCVHYVSHNMYACDILVQDGEAVVESKPAVTNVPKLFIQSDISTDQRTRIVRESLAKGMTYNEIVKASNGFINLYFINKLIREQGHGTKSN